ncbi:LysR family transcriptional regulator [Curvibacter sp. CHRR-16]|uniref:LysR substrate-binding domain-containing protein n=1 Tax=Curvibacter sp. CHRR-16 TaxID=2835872 RepID=UPI001BDA9437|nr:LysR substrate-binding domain-containing protein [Curvibacter sp. CHRR-16]MBT0570760.1 LysR family transcriptional regulator [Curvibacter sp. CHRR-16]
MTITRRTLPSMRELVAFEAAARLNSFTAAAQELHLTQSAVSRLIRALEEQLGGELFMRERQTVRLNAAGMAYAHEVRSALSKIGSATLTFRANPQAAVLNLAVLPFFGMRWLAPRLKDFYAQHPGLAINLTTRLTQFDFQLDSVDAAIHFGHADWPGAEHMPLLGETMVAVCSPSLLDGADPALVLQPQQVLQWPLIHVSSRPDAWERWCAHWGLEGQGLHGVLVDQFSLALESALAGIGVALLPVFLVEGELRQGRLQRLWPEAVPSPGRYFLVWPTARTGYGPLQQFSHWLAGQVQQGV